jgi:hypothetical protein
MISSSIDGRELVKAGRITCPLVTSAVRIPPEAAAFDPLKNANFWGSRGVV